jgi:hypothetical protein
LKVGPVIVLVNIAACEGLGLQTRALEFRVPPTVGCHLLVDGFEVPVARVVIGDDCVMATVTPKSFRVLDYGAWAVTA